MINMYKRTWIFLMILSLIILISSAFGISYFRTGDGSIEQVLKEETNINQINKFDSCYCIYYTYNNKKYELYVNDDIYDMIIKEKYKKEN